MPLPEEQRWLHAQIVAPAAHVPLGIAIYRNAYRERLVQTLHAMFPALLHALGDALFDAFAHDFIDRDPPRGYSLERLAQRFPLHLANTRPDEPWAQFIVELAALEGAFREIYDAPANASRTFHFTYPVREYLADVRNGGSPSLPAPREEDVEVRRAGYRVVMFRI